MIPWPTRLVLSRPNITMPGRLMLMGLEDVLPEVGRSTGVFLGLRSVLSGKRK